MGQAALHPEGLCLLQRSPELAVDGDALPLPHYPAGQGWGQSSRWAALHTCAFCMWLSRGSISIQSGLTPTSPGATPPEAVHTAPPQPFISLHSSLPGDVLEAFVYLVFHSPLHRPEAKAPLIPGRTWHWLVFHICSEQWGFQCQSVRLGMTWVLGYVLWLLA